MLFRWPGTVLLAAVCQPASRIAHAHPASERLKLLTLSRVLSYCRYCSMPFTSTAIRRIQSSCLGSLQLQQHSSKLQQCTLYSKQKQQAKAVSNAVLMGRAHQPQQRSRLCKRALHPRLVLRH